MPKRKRCSKLTKGVKKKSNPRPWTAVGTIMEEIYVAVQSTLKMKRFIICTLEFDCHADCFLAPVGGTEQLITQKIEIFAVNETHNEHEEPCLSPFQTLCNLLQVSITDTYILSCTDTEICIVELYHFSCKEMSIKLSDVIHSNIINECLIIKILFIPGMSFVLLYLGLIIEKGWNDV